MAPTPDPHRKMLCLVLVFTIALSLHLIWVAMYNPVLVNWTRPYPTALVLSFSLAETTLQQPPAEPRFHYVFSTGCSTYQDWQSYAFFYHMLLLHTTADVTRIASGCSASEAAELERIFEREIRSMSGRFHLHQTPDYSLAHEGIPKRKPYKFFNKPMGLQHWLDHGLRFSENRQTLDDVIFVLLDPDELVVRPFTKDYTRNRNMVWHAPLNLLHTRIAHGQPMAQLYALGSQWAEKINMDAILNSTTTPSAMRHWTAANLENHYAAGPPYLATGRDMYTIVSLWSKFVVEVYRQQSAAHLSEMYAYAVAAAHANLPHQLVASFMVSNVVADDNEEGWASIDALPDHRVCRHPPTAPYVLHYCQRYMLGDFVFTKYLFPSNFLTCDHALLAAPNASFATMGHTQARPPNGQVYDIAPERRKRHMYMLCELLPRLNQVAAFWKQQHCQLQANYAETYQFPAERPGQNVYGRSAY